jgi:hypothetical protein
MSIPSGFFPSYLLTSPVFASTTCSLHFLLPYLITQAIFGEVNVSYPGLYRLLTFQVAHLKTLLYQRISPSQRPREGCCNISIFYSDEYLALRPTPKLEAHRLSAVCDCLLNTFAATLHFWWQFLLPQPEGAPCCVDRNPLMWEGRKGITQYVGAISVCADI